MTFFVASLSRLRSLSVLHAVAFNAPLFSVQHAVERPSRERTTCKDAYGSDSGANHESLALDISPLFAVAIARCAFSCSVESCCCTGTFAAVASWNALAMLVATTSFQNCWIGARRQTSFRLESAQGDKPLSMEWAQGDKPLFDAIVAAYARGGRARRFRRPTAIVVRIFRLRHGGVACTRQPKKRYTIARKVQEDSQIRRATKDVAKRKTREGNSARIATASGANRDSSL